MIMRFVISLLEIAKYKPNLYVTLLSFYMADASQNWITDLTIKLIYVIDINIVALMVGFQNSVDEMGRTIEENAFLCMSWCSGTGNFGFILLFA